MRRALLILLLLTGCPPSGPTPPQPSTAPVATATTAGPTSAGDPLAGGIFTREEVMAIYRTEHVAGLPGASDAAKAERDAMLRTHRLVGDDGKENAPRMAAYERALETLAKDEAHWAEFVETLPGREEAQAPGPR